MTNNDSRLVRLISIIRGLVFLLILCLIAMLVILFITSRGTDRDYAIDYTLPAADKWVDIGLLEVGVGIRDITPPMENYDTWTDIDGNGAFDPQIDQ